jgi:membrane associated rhomboid family serine protease
MIQGGFSALPEITKNLMIINGIMLLAVVLYPELYQTVSLYYFSNEMFKPWQIVTHMFTHAGFLHLFFNMFALFMFGGVLERMLGPQRFLAFYLFTGFGGAFLHVMVNVLQVYLLSGEIWLTQEMILGLNISLTEKRELYSIYQTPMVGASGAVFGILTAFGVLFPNARLMLLFPPIPVKAKVFIPILIVLELVSGIAGQGNIAHFAHLGGALFGYLLLKYWRKSNIF